MSAGADDAGGAPNGDDDGRDADDVDDFLREVAHVEDMSPPARQPLVGQTLGRFRILSELGRGGMGIVYLAHDENLRREVALKLLPPSLTRQEERYRRFLREARTAASVTHMNLATIYDVGEVEGNAFIAMERIEGTTLRKLLAQGALSIEQAASFAAQILAGLSKAHRAGIVHRDLKPDNVMVTDEQVVKLLDFGLAKRHEPAGRAALDAGDGVEATRDTAADQLLGTPGYMSPEQVRGLPLDQRSDIFSVGVILYEMLAGRRPFQGTSHADLQSAILRDVPSPLSEQRDDLPAALGLLVARCLEKDPARRFQDCAEICASLAGMDTGSGRFITPSSSSLRHAASAPVTPPGPPARLLEARHRRAGAALILAGMLAAVVLVTRPDDQGPAREPLAKSVAPMAAAVADSQQRPTAVTDLPLPASKSPEAVAAYAAALQGIRDGNWGYVASHLERAITLDPGMASAHLRNAIVQYDTPLMRLARGSFARAVLGRSQLSERDQVLLNVYEPLLGRDPPDKKELAARLKAATERYPQDAELFSFVALVTRDPEAALKAARRAVEIDPQYADGWQMVGANLFQLGHKREALDALGRCIAISPAAVDCRAERGALYASEGRCAEMDDDLRHAVAGSNSGVWQDERAVAVFALGRPPEAVLEVYRNKWAQLPESERKVTEQLDRGKLAFALGRFREAEDVTRAAEQLVESDAEAAPHARVALQLIQIYLETNRLEKASRVADEYLKRMDVWIASEESDRAPMIMYWTMLRARALSLEQFVQRREDWLRENESGVRSLTRRDAFGIYAAGVETKKEASEALRLFADVSQESVLSRRDFSRNMFGGLLLLAGQPERALPYLEEYVHSCWALEMPLLHVRATYHYGQALEEAGYKVAACDAYGDVVTRWGSARPPSVTASKARGRLRALRCPPESSDGAR